jgi:hypothetical protein
MSGNFFLFMTAKIDNKVNYNLFINSFFGVVIFILFVLANAFKSITLSYLTFISAILNLALIVYYYHQALSNKDSLKDFGRVKRQSIYRLISALGFIILSSVMIIMYK